MASHIRGFDSLKAGSVHRRTEEGPGALWICLLTFSRLPWSCQFALFEVGKVDENIRLRRLGHFDDNGSLL
jgi:hypothetical protein